MQEQTSDQIRTYYICRLCCIEEGILTKLLTERREEIIMTSILQYDQAAHEAALHDDGYDEGYETGQKLGEKLGEKRGEKRGEMKTRVSAVQSLMETMKLSADQALDALKIQGKERESIIKAVQG